MNCDGEVLAVCLLGAPHDSPHGATKRQFELLEGCNKAIVIGKTTILPLARQCSSKNPRKTRRNRMWMGPTLTPGEAE